MNSPFSISTDGSNSGDSKLYPVIVTYFNRDTCRIENKLLSVPSLNGDSTGENISNLLLNELKNINVPLENCISFSADNAPVMLGKKAGVVAFLKRKIPNLMVMGCPCHLLNLAAEKASASLPISIDEFLVDIFYYLEKSTKRKEKLAAFQKLHDNDVHKILKHVCTRWLSVGKCLERLIEQWVPLTSFFNSEVRCVNSKDNRPISLSSYSIPKLDHPSKSVQETSVNKNKFVKRKLEPAHTSKPSKILKSNSTNLSREEKILMFLTSKFNKALSLFLLTTIKCFETPNIVLQSSQPHIHVLNSILIDTLKDLMSKFVKADVVKTAKSILEVDYHRTSNQKSDCDIFIGASTTKLVDELSQEEKNMFFDSIKKYFLTACDYIIHKFPINSDILKHAEVAQITNIEHAKFGSIQFFVKNFPILLKLKGGEDEDTAMDLLHTQFCSLQLDELDTNNFQIDSRGIDEIWNYIGTVADISGHLKYDRLSYFMLGLLTVPHSNAECERIFSSVKKTRTQFRSSISDNNLEKILIAKSSSGKCFEREFDSDFLKRAKSATFVKNNL